MSLPSVPPASRPRCDVCALPLRTCICALVTRVRNEVDVLVLQHPDEAVQAKGSARLLQLSLARCRVVVGESWHPERLSELLGRDVSTVALLYPQDTLRGPTGPAGARVGGLPQRLVVLDGTWRKSLRMLHANPLLQTLPRWFIEPCGARRYGALRKARLATQLATLEATCAALADIESAPARYEPLLQAFDRFVADRLSLARGAT